MSEFEECERRWAYRYCWYDFEYFEFPDPLKRECQFHSKLMGNEAFAGQVVHDVIDETLRARVTGGLDLVEPLDRAKEIAREYVAESRIFAAAYESAERAPKLHRQPLQRLFFHLGFDGHAKAEFRKAVESALMNFLDSELYKNLMAEDAAYFEFPPQGGAPWFFDGRVPVYANFDFALRKPEQTTLFDWKTGKVNKWSEADVTDQLHTYAAYAMETWKIPAEELKLVAVWLAAGKDQTHEIGVDPNRLQKLRMEWRERHQTLIRRREDAKGDMEKLFKVFPMTGIEKKKCRSCSFRFCEGYVQTMAAEADQTDAANRKDR